MVVDGADDTVVEAGTGDDLILQTYYSYELLHFLLHKLAAVPPEKPPAARLQYCHHNNSNLYYDGGNDYVVVTFEYSYYY